MTDTLRPRKHEITGLHNFRDTGGYTAATGTTRWGRLFRSDALHRIDDTGAAALAELGITDVVDLRGSAERESAPNRLDGLTVHHLPVFDDADPSSQLTADVSLETVYDHIIDHRGEAIARAVAVIADAADGGVLIHCTAGKDRTGLVIALALLAVGVDRTEVIADYAATEEHLAGEWAETMIAAVTSRGVELSADTLALITASPAALLEKLLDRIEAEYGSAAGYLSAHGITAEQLDRLTTALIDTEQDAS